MSDYSFECACGATLKAEANNKEEAVQQLIPKAEQHIAQVHADLKMSADEVKNMLKSGVKQLG